MPSVEVEVVKVHNNKVTVRKDSEDSLLSLKMLKTSFTVVFDQNPGFDKGDKIKISAEKVGESK
jgi:hypothetical protein